MQEQQQQASLLPLDQATNCIQLDLQLLSQLSQAAGQMNHLDSHARCGKDPLAEHHAGIAAQPELVAAREADAAQALCSSNKVFALIRRSHIITPTRSTTLGIVICSSPPGWCTSIHKKWHTASKQCPAISSYTKRLLTWASDRRG